MSFSFGLNVKPKASSAPVKKPAAKSALVLGNDDSDDEESGKAATNEESITSFNALNARQTKPQEARKAPKVAKKASAGPPSLSRPPASLNKTTDDYSDLAQDEADRKAIKATEEADSSIYDYDSFHAAQTTVRDARKAEERQEALERKPKYINNLLDAAARRKQDQLIAREKVLQREREAEGDEFADKEKFVTSAYKKQQEEARLLQEEEARNAEAEAARRAKQGGGMSGFYRSVLGSEDPRRLEAEKAAKLLESGGVNADTEGEHKQTDREIAEEMRKKGIDVTLNDEGVITDKRQLLSAGLNVGTGPKSAGANGAEHLRTRPAANPYRAQRGEDARAQRERQTRQMEEQLEAAAKRKREEEDAAAAELERKAKSTKTSTEVSDAKARYLARKAEREAAKAKGA